MDTNEFLEIFRNSLRAITDSRFFMTERGYQGQLIAELSWYLDQHCLLEKNPIIEQEYQKKNEVHGTKIRPDIIIHVPFERKLYRSRTRGNYVAILLKRNAYLRGARKDFNDIEYMFESLKYRLGIFLNINSRNTYFDDYDGNYRRRLHCFAVKLINDVVDIVESP